MKRKNRIIIDQWLALKPYRRHSTSDRYYLQLSNKVYEALRYSPLTFLLEQLLDDDAMANMSCFLTAYFEDVISGTRLWQTFRQEHQKLYRKKLPFFTAGRDYEPEEINVQDVRLLLWYYLNLAEEDRFLNPHQELLAALAEVVMEVFEDAWEDAPENELLQACYQLPPDSDYYAVRQFIDGLLFKSYLFFPDTGTELILQSLELAHHNDEPESLPLMAYELRDRMLHQSRTRLLAYTGKEWAAALLGPKHPLQQHILQLSKRVQGLFLYKEQGATHIRLEHIASGREFLLYKPSFDHAHTLKQPDALVYISLVEWQGEWWFSGTHFQRPYDPTAVAEERRSFKAKQEVAFLDHQERRETTREIMAKHRQAFLDFNGGKPIAFMATPELESFNRRFIEFYTQSLQLSEEKLAESRERARAAGYPENPDFSLGIDLSDKPEDVLYFFNPRVGGEMLFGYNSAFPDPDNLFYREEEQDETVQMLLMGPDASPELVKYLIEQYGDNIAFFQKGRGKKYLKDLDFLLRFWKTNTYRQEPALTLIGP